tara:strand:- start:293 stop:1711 length:1419 start_codon:yes stop_codon:yes gene_type:complete
MATDLSASTVQAGSKAYYSFDVVDSDTGKIIESFNTTDKKKAQDYVNSRKENVDTINNKPSDQPGSDPFKDGTFADQGDPSGPVGFASAPEYDEYGNPTSSDPESPYTIEEALSDNPSATSAGNLPEGKSPLGSSKLQKAARDWCGLDPEEKKVIESLPPKELEEVAGGVGGDKMTNAMCNRLTLPSEKVVGRSPDGNAFIICGGDRVDNPISGYRGKGHTQCDAIDLVAGLGGFCPKGSEEVEITDVDGSTTTIQGSVETNPNFFVDAARIYISQKTDVDKNFGIAEFGNQEDPNNEPNEEDIGKYGAKSAVVAKADNIRLIGRESLKLVTGTDEFNSAGGRVSGKHGIELIAMNKIEDLQPLVKGDNLALALTMLVKNVEALAEMFQANMHYQMKFNKALQSHTHITPFFAIRDLPSEPAIMGGIQCDIENMVNTELSVVKHITNLQGFITNFLADSGESYICSSLNKTN